jgi:hypothetical protein
MAYRVVLTDKAVADVECSANIPLAPATKWRRHVAVGASPRKADRALRAATKWRRVGIDGASNSTPRRERLGRDGRTPGMTRRARVDRRFRPALHSAAAARLIRSRRQSVRGLTPAATCPSRFAARQRPPAPSTWGERLVRQYIEHNCILTQVLVYGIIPLRITNPPCLPRRGGNHMRHWRPSCLFGCGIPPLAPPSGRRFTLRGRADGQDFGRCCPVCRAHARLLSTNWAFEHAGATGPHTWTDTPTLGQLPHPPGGPC